MSVDRSMDTLVSSMIATSRNQDLVANNLANASTVGFRKDSLAFQSYYDAASECCSDVKTLSDEVYYGYIPADVSVMVDAQYTSKEAGSFMVTGNSLDIAIQGDGLFAINTPYGERYTRAGDFTVNEAGFVVTQAGYSVMGQSGPIHVNGGEINVLDNGAVQLNGLTIDKLKIMDKGDMQGMVKEQGTMYRYEGDDALSVLVEPTVRQGYLEASNVNPVEEINAMTVNMRAFEASSKAVKTMERTLTRAINGVGKA